MQDSPQGCKGLDCFRILAVLLVIAIHTSPLSSISPSADFVLTRILARVAVPFFFMVTGFFLLPRLTATRTEKPAGRAALAGFLKKAGLLYAASILLYLPLNRYAGHFASNTTVFSVVKAVVFDGTFYHLWYLPAGILGVLLVAPLMQKSKNALIPAVLILYCMGLFGDSYYGIAARAPALKGLYDALFTLFDYTRNGLFFAPVFLVMGWYLADQKTRLGAKMSALGFAVSLSLLVAEGLFLRSLHVRRHDSMYLMLLPCLYFLFQWLLLPRGRGQPQLRTFAMLVYIVHPLCIVLVRGFARVAGCTSLLVYNSPVHFAAVAVVSFALCLAPTLLWHRLRCKPAPKARAWAEISLPSLIHNLKSMQEVLPEGCAVMAVVKANAYGHGAVALSKALYRQGVRHFAVATAAEGVSLRRHGIGGEILVLGYTGAREFPLLWRYRLTQTVVDCAYAEQLSRYGKRLLVQVKIDTGMNRLGEPADRADAIATIYRDQNLRVRGTFSHLSLSDSLREEDVSYTQAQIGRFDRIVSHLRARGLELGMLHIQSSYGVLNHPSLSCDCARIGIALYGVLSAQGDKTALTSSLRPVFSLKARVVLTKTVSEGECVGYGRSFTAPRAMRIAVVSIGYADGLPRNLSPGGGSVLLKGRRAKIIGSICMDQLTVDITDIEGVSPDDTATVIGVDGAERITAEEVAHRTGSITNELLSRMSSRRIKRIYER